jgi:hypothetical protein
MAGPPHTLSRRRFCVTMMAAAAGIAVSACSSGVGRTPSPSTSEAPNPPLQFPDGFKWGVATSAYQIEGAVAADGRGRSIWDTFCARPGTITDGSSGAVACDHYHRWESDLDLMHSLGIGSYRFSIAWPRVLPEGRGPLNRRGLDFYDRLVDRLLARGISPVATLYHWDLPQALQDRGGWENRDSAEWFADYATVLFEALGDRVSQWLTINEAKVIAEQGYQYGRMAPGKNDLRASGTVIHHLNLAHGRAAAAFRGINGIGRIGPCLQLAPCYPRTITRSRKPPRWLPIPRRTLSISTHCARAAIQTSAVRIATSLPVLKRQPEMGTLPPLPHSSTSLGSTTTRPSWSMARDDRSNPIPSPQRAGSRFIRKAFMTSS